jgi:hypothetical protein
MKFGVCFSEELINSNLDLCIGKYGSINSNYGPSNFPHALKISVSYRTVEKTLIKIIFDLDM